MPITSRKTFATNSLKLNFLWDVWFLRQIDYRTIEHPWIINEIPNTNSTFFWTTLKTLEPILLFSYI